MSPSRTLKKNANLPKGGHNKKNMDQEKQNQSNHKSSINGYSTIGEFYNGEKVRITHSLLCVQDSMRPFYRITSSGLVL